MSNHFKSDRGLVCVLAAVAFWALAFSAFYPGTAKATILPITGNETTVSLTSYDFLTDAGFMLAPLGDATLNAEVTPPEITFPITGGTVDTETNVALIEHDNSGFSMEKDDNTALFENFLINTGDGLLTSQATVDSTVVNDFPLFDVDSETLALTLTPEAATVIDDTFGVGGLSGAEIGVASVDLTTGEPVAPPGGPVPEPTTLLLLGSGIVALAGYGRKKRRLGLKP